MNSWYIFNPKTLFPPPPPYDKVSSFITLFSEMGLSVSEERNWVSQTLVVFNHIRNIHINCVRALLLVVRTVARWVNSPLEGGSSCGEILQQYIWSWKLQHWLSRKALRDMIYLLFFLLYIFSSLSMFLSFFSFPLGQSVPSAGSTRQETFAAPPFHHTIVHSL